MPLTSAGVLRTAEGVLVVRRPGVWALTPSMRRDAIEVTVGQLLALLDGGGALDPVLTAELADAGVLVARPDDGDGHPTGPPTEVELPPALDQETVLEPREAVLARISRGALEVESVDGELVRLAPVDVCLLDVIDHWMTVAQAIDAVGDRFGIDTDQHADRARLAHHLARLAATGRVRVPVRPDTDPAATGRTDEPVRVPTVPATAPDDRPAAAARDERPSPHALDAPEVVYLDHPFPGGPSGPVPVYAVWPTLTGPVLALGMLTAAARRHDGGRLAEWYEIRRPEEPRSFFADLQRRQGPAILLLSNYMWSADQNLAIARKARRRCPDVVVVHGGPSTPKYEGDVDQFFSDHDGLVDITVRGEGEATMVAILEALGPSFPNADLTRLRAVAGLSYRDPGTGAIVRTPDRERVADLDQLPSAYLTGEFDHLPNEVWEVPSGLLGMIFESNRGCPYGCTFCDWGSSTLSRIRKFDLDRVEAEMRWAAERGLGAWMITDANFGIISRDVEIAERMGALKSRYGHPGHFGFNVAKNTTKHLTAILDRLIEAEIVPHFSLALQTRDESTLEAVERTNISTDHYLALAASFRRRGLPLDADVMVGLPGQTVDSFAGDLQFLLDHEIPARMWITELLPNAPMNEPSYRDRFAIETDEHRVVVATSSFTVDDRRTMMRLRHAYTAFERFGILRYVVRYAQWDHGVPAMAIHRRIVELGDDDPDRYPLLNWVSRYFDHFNIPPLGWRSFFAEVGTFLDREFGIGPSPDRDLVLRAQAFLLPEAGREFPARLALRHDLVRYVRDHTRGLWGDGVPSSGGPLTAYGPVELVVHDDPLDRCGRGQAVTSDPRNEILTANFWIAGHWELDSPLVTNYSEVAGAGSYVGRAETIPPDLGDDVSATPDLAIPLAAPVTIGGTAGPVRARAG